MPSVGTGFDAVLSRAVSGSRYANMVHDHATGTVDGPWMSVANLIGPTLHVFGGFVGTVELEGSNLEVPVAASAILLDSITSPELVAIDPNVNHIRVNVSAYTSGAISAIIGAELPG